MNLPSKYKGPLEALSTNWARYGGTREFLHSPYLHAAVVITLFSGSQTITSQWSDTVLQVMPNILGFTLTGYSVIVGFGNDKFQDLLSKTKLKSGHSAYMDFNTSFFIFIIFQILTLIYASVTKSQPFLFWARQFHLHLDSMPTWVYYFIRYASRTGWFIGYTLFIYSLLLGVAATISVYRLSNVYDSLKREATEAEDK